jgi:glucose-1-phosphate adenylyltransferase
VNNSGNCSTTWRRNSFIAEGVVVRDARIVNSVIRRDVTIEDDVLVEDSIVMDHTVLKRGCRLKRVIVDKFNVLAEGERIGFGPDADRLQCACHRDPSGISVVPKGERLMKRPPW